MRKGDTILFETRPPSPSLQRWAASRRARARWRPGSTCCSRRTPLGRETWEQSESQLQRHCLDLALQRRISPPRS